MPIICHVSTVIEHITNFSSRTEDSLIFFLLINKIKVTGSHVKIPRDKGSNITFEFTNIYKILKMKYVKKGKL